MPYQHFLHLAQRENVFLQWVHLSLYVQWYEDESTQRTFFERGHLPAELTPSLALERYNYYLKHRTCRPE